MSLRSRDILSVCDVKLTFCRARQKVVSAHLEWWSAKSKRQYLLTCKVSRCCLFGFSDYHCNGVCDRVLISRHRVIFSYESVSGTGRAGRLSANVCQSTACNAAALPCKAKRQCLLTLQVRRYCLLAVM